MGYLPAILFLLSLWRYSPEPDYLAPTPHGLFPDFGFDQNDSEEIAPILHLLRTGVKKVEEVDYDNGSIKSTSSYYIYSNGDSITIEAQSIYDNKLRPEYVEKFSHEGKLLYRVDFWRDRMSDSSFYDLDGSWVKYEHIRYKKYGKWIDTIILKFKITYDSFGRPIEEDGFDAFEEFMDFGKIANKTIYNYWNNGSEIEELKYKRKQGDNSWESNEKYEKYKHERKYGPVEYLLDMRKLKRIDSIVRSIETVTYDYDNGDSNRFVLTYDVTYYDKNWYPIRKNRKKRYHYSSKISEEDISYTRDVNGLLLSQKIAYPDGSEGDTEKWSYDKNGNCIVHSRGNNRETWTYDEKGNVVRYYARGYVNEFKIFYK